ncbi:protein-disulfide reductase DsbD family protein [Flavobacteriales bacterium]|nr:protein-disulfide reductase DsbD family protein [Flavobacteriales bacterium]
MNRILLFICLCLTSGLLQAQAESPVTVAQSKMIKGDTLQLTIDFIVDNDWMVYDSVSSDLGPIPLTFNFDGIQNLTYLNVEKPHLKTKYDDIFEVDLWYFKDTVSYVFNFKKGEALLESKILGSFEFMSCNLISGVCLPPQVVDFVVE